MKTPEGIKLGLQHCSVSGIDTCVNCPYDDGHIDCAKDKNNDALAYIEQLESRLAQVERERDAAVNDLDKALNLDEVDDCHFCKHIKKPTCYECKWEWRGVCPENTKEE